ncbi:DUF1876 domain-containing protein [Prescottella agglutinans]|uniref:DUF1876 domain-containing protein n=1 Tax=Prescottella agglutinans TaxID=1644129 RepID=A0A3S3AJZ3_9NOCA|nr:DUF1876 domain-containing protein [Prescottella agglutinans]RVW10088.1 DUF1876 domain-containing protein [Prescottella agglutinans]
MDTKQWNVDITIDEHESRTRSTARLHTKETTMVGVGLARRNPLDRNVPGIGDELATARALADLTHQLIEATVGDIEGVTHTPAHLSE